MRWVLSLAALALGVVLAGAGGSRLGADVRDWRSAELAEETVAAPPPGVRLGQWWAEGGPLWLAGIVLVVGGALGARREITAEASSGGSSAPPAEVIASLRAEVRALRASLEGLAEEADAAEVRAALDRLQLDLIDPLVEARGAAFARQGVARAAAWFSPFSGAERQLHRAWSALTDGYVGTAREALDAALASLEAAADALAAVEEEIASA